MQIGYKIQITFVLKIDNTLILNHEKRYHVTNQNILFAFFFPILAPSLKTYARRIMEARTSHEYVGSRIGRLGRAHVYHIACWAFINGDRTQIGLRKNPTCVQNGLNCYTIHHTIVFRFLGHVVSIIFRAFVTN